MPCHSSVPHSHHNVMVGAKELVQMSQGNEQLPRIPRTRCPSRLNQLPTECSKPTEKVRSKQSCIPWLTILRDCSWAGTRLKLGMDDKLTWQWKIPKKHLSIQAVNMWRWAHVLKFKVHDPFDFPRNGFWQFWVSVCQISGRIFRKPGNSYELEQNLKPQIWLALAGATWLEWRKFTGNCFPNLWVSDARTACKDMPLSFVYLEELLPNFRWTKKGNPECFRCFLFRQFWALQLFHVIAPFFSSKAWLQNGPWLLGSLHN